MDDTRAAMEGQQKRLLLFSHRRTELYQEAEITNYEVRIKDIPSVNVRALRETLPDYAQEHILWHKLGQFMAKEKIARPTSLEARGYSLHHDED